MQQLALFTQHKPVALTDYDYIVISSSGGKDSQAMLAHVHAQAVLQDVEDRLVVVHADLGDMEWPGTRDIAQAQADVFGVPFEVVSRIGQVAKQTSALYTQGEVYGDLLDYAMRRGSWPSAQARWCTSEFKRGPISRFLTNLAKQHPTKPCLILDCWGLRAEESPARAKKHVLSERKRTRNQHIDTWLPIHHWEEARVWETIRATKMPVHPAYALGMGRLSCVFCILAPKAQLQLAAKHNPELFERYVEVEQALEHTFKHKLALAEI